MTLHTSASVINIILILYFYHIDIVTNQVFCMRRGFTYFHSASNWRFLRFEKVGIKVGSSFYFFAAKITYPFSITIFLMYGTTKTNSTSVLEMTSDWPRDKYKGHTLEWTYVLHSNVSSITNVVVRSSCFNLICVPLYKCVYLGSNAFQLFRASAKLKTISVLLKRVLNWENTKHKEFCIFHALF